MKLFSRKGQSTGEYAILFAIVLGAVIAMQNYVRNQIAGELKAQADNYGNATAVDITRESDSVQASRATMTSARDGVLGSQSGGNQVLTVPQ